MTLKQIHYFTGIVLTAFIGLHLFNHFFSIYGPQQHIEIMNALRVVYRNVFIETILLLSAGLQIYSGIRLWRKKSKPNNFFERIQIWSGLYLAFFLLIHIGAVLTGRFILQLDTNFYFGAAGLNSFPVNLFFIPYYTLAIVSFFGHIAAVHHSKMNKTILGVSIKTQSYHILIVGCLVALVLVFFLTNQYQGFEVPKEYHILQLK